jgi:outer membrane biosynthesis protein TonB
MRKNSMRRMQSIVLLVALAATMPVLAGCSSLDPDQWDFFGLNEKKKLPGDRKQLFPEGVPGVSQGIPPEYVKGNQPPEGTETPLAALPAEPPRATPVDEPKPKPKKAKVAKQKLIPDNSPPPAQAQQPGQWPAANQPQPPQQSGGAAWPSNSSSGTVAR